MTQVSDIQDVYRLTPMQQGLLVKGLAAPAGARGYVVQWRGTLRQASRIDTEALARAYQCVVERHTMLRTCVVWEGLDEPVQVVRANVYPKIAWLDWRALTPDQQQEQLQIWLRDDAEQGFDLRKAPLMRMTVIRLTEDSCEFVWSFHHVALDGWSAYLVANELLRFYEAFQTGQALDLPPARPFRDYVAWLQSQNMPVAEAFWREQLRGFCAPTPLPIERHSAHIEGATFAFVLPPKLSRDLETLARKLRLTPSTLLLGAWAVLLGRYAGQRDVLFGTMVTGRPPDLEGVESMVGLFLNTLPLRARLPERQKVADWLRDVQLQQAHMRAFNYTPLVQAQTWSELPAGVPLFSTVVTIQNFYVDPRMHEEASRLEVDGAAPVAFDNIQLLSQAEYPLALRARLAAQIALELVYDRGRLDASAVERLATHYQHILEQFVSRPDQPLREIDLLPLPQRGQVLVAWNDTARPLPDHMTVRDLVAAQVRARPQSLAVDDAHGALTFAQLDARAAALAAWLRARGVGPEVTVALCAERSAALVVGMLGILKAGGAYLPIDPSLPRDRRDFMVADSGAAALLTNADLSWIEVSAADDVAIGPDNLAYVIYTSGSTGQPKGVEVSHTGLLNLVQWHVRQYDVTPEDRASVVAGVSFDASTWEIWPYLAAGASLHIPDEATRSDPRLLLEWLAAERITLSFLPTPLAEAVLAEQSAYPQPLALRALLTGGDRLHHSPSSKMGFAFVNHYGPTENSVVATAGAVTGDAGAPPPIGRPIDNTRLHVLDPAGRPMPIGVPGELFIGGRGLARGYHCRPDLTAERFVPDPLSGAWGARMYRTGDLVRWTPDGQLDFLGRLDFQVKVRGYRVELGEIESALLRDSSIREAVVVAREDIPGDVRLIAYTVPATDAPLNAEQLRATLARDLPDYMVPHTFVSLDALPLTSNGKVDRRALPAPEAAQANFVEPATDLERAIASVWQQVLRLDRVSAEDNFFEVGGNSILLIEVNAHLREKLGQDIPSIDLFMYPTVRLFAQHLSSELTAAPAQAEGHDRGRARAASLARRASAHIRE